MWVRLYDGLSGSKSSVGATQASERTALRGASRPQGPGERPNCSHSPPDRPKFFRRCRWDWTMWDWRSAGTDNKRRAIFYAHTNCFSTFTTYWREKMHFARWWVRSQQLERESEQEAQARCERAGEGLGGGEQCVARPAHTR